MKTYVCVNIEKLVEDLIFMHQRKGLLKTYHNYYYFLKVNLNILKIIYT